MKGKKLACLLLCCLLGFSLFGCSKPEEAREPATPPLEISLLQDGKFAVTCEQIVPVYEDALNRYGKGFWQVQEDDGSYQVFSEKYSATLAFSKSGGEGEGAVTAGLHEKMDTIAVSSTFDFINEEFSDGGVAIICLILMLNPAISVDEAKQIWFGMVENLQNVSDNFDMSKKEINGVTFTLGFVHADVLTGVVILSASTDPNVTVQM